MYGDSDRCSRRRSWRRYAALIGAIIIVAFTIGYLGLRSAEKRSIASDFDQLKKGMTVAEVEAIIGKPAEMELKVTGSRQLFWVGPDWQIEVAISDGSGLVFDGKLIFRDGRVHKLDANPERRYFRW